MIGLDRSIVNHPVGILDEKMKDMKKIVSTVSIILTWLVVILTPYLIRAKKLLKARPFVSLRVTALLAILTIAVILSGAKNLYSAVSWTETTRTDWNGGFI